MPLSHPNALGSHALAATAVAALLVGCGVSKPPKQANDDYGFTPTTTPAERSSYSPSDPEPSGESGGLNKEQKEQMEVALRRGSEKAAQCVDVVPGATSGEGEVRVVFDGTKGRAVDVNVGSPFAGGPAESCIKRAFIGEIILPFEGEPTMEVPHTVKLPEKKKSAGGDGK